jgi:hypothetical protein
MLRLIQQLLVQEGRSPEQFISLNVEDYSLGRLRDPDRQADAQNDAEILCGRPWARSSNHRRRACTNPRGTGDYRGLRGAETRI